MRPFQSAFSHSFKGKEFGFGHIFSLLNYKATAIYLRGERKSNFSYPLQGGAEYIAKNRHFGVIVSINQKMPLGN
jgi:hypothetical protein